MVPYNTNMQQLRLPEYGRNIQQLIDFCITIEDREERTRCASAIASVMANLFPEIVADGNGMRKIWDHINIMSDFKLDIDWPCEVITADKVNPRPARIPYGTTRIRWRHYGKGIEKMIETVADMEPSQDKDELIWLIANQMKKQMLLHNKEGVSDARILHDLAEYSQGKIVLDAVNYHLCEYKQGPDQAPQQRKKKKK